MDGFSTGWGAFLFLFSFCLFVVNLTTIRRLSNGLELDCRPSNRRWPLFAIVPMARCLLVDHLCCQAFLDEIPRNLASPCRPNRLGWPTNVEIDQHLSIKRIVHLFGLHIGASKCVGANRNTRPLDSAINRQPLTLAYFYWLKVADWLGRIWRPMVQSNQ